MKLSFYLPKRITLLTLITLSFVVIYSCGDDDDDDPIPTPTPTPTKETVAIYLESDREGEVYRGLDANNKVLTTGNTNNDAKTAELSITTTSYKSENSKEQYKSTPITLARVVGLFGKDTIYDAKNVTLTEKPETKDISDKKTQYSHIIEWYGNVDDSYWTGWQNGKAHPVQKARIPSDATAIITYTFFDDKNETVMDSLIGTVEGYKDVIAKNIPVKDYTLYTGGNEYGEFQFTVGNTGGETSTGDVAIRINHEGQYKSQSTITITNTELPQYTYGPFDTGEEIRYIFKDVAVGENGSSIYEVKVESNLEDFITTKANIQVVEDVEGEKNGVKDVYVTDVPDEQNITFKVTNSKTREPESGAFVEVYRANYDDDGNISLGEYLSGGTSDSDGNARVAGIPDNTEIITRKTRFDSYPFITGTYHVPDVEFTYESEAELGTTIITVEFDESTGQRITEAQLNLYRPVPNFEWSNSHMYLNLPETNQKEGAKEGFDELEKNTGKEGTIIYSDNTFQNPTPSMIENYDPIDDANTFPGQIGINVEYSGTKNNYITAILADGTKYISHVPSFKLGGSTPETRKHLYHETFQAFMGFPQISDGEENIITCLDPENPKDATPMDYKMTDIYYGTNNTFGLVQNASTTAPNGKTYEYSIRYKKFE